MFEGAENKERDQDRMFDLFDHYKRWGFILFPENEKIYNYLASEAKGSILEAGCGNGVGTGILAANHPYKVVGTDKIEGNVKFAQAIFPWIHFEVWDISKQPFGTKFDTVVCVETIEHVKNYREAIKNLISSATKEAWISTPMPDKPEYPPSNPYHVREFTEEEMREMIGDYKIEIPFKGLFHVIL